MVNDETLFPTNVVYTTHDWHDTIDAVRSIERSGGIVGMDIKTFRRATPSSVGRSGKIGLSPIFPDLPTDDGVARRNVLMSTPTIPPDLSIDLTASIVSCQSCVVYTTFVGNSVSSFTTSKLNCQNECSKPHVSFAWLFILLINTKRAFSLHVSQRCLAVTAKKRLI